MRFLGLIVFLLVMISITIFGSRELYFETAEYNCLIFNGVQVRLNTHLEMGVPSYREVDLSPDQTHTLLAYGQYPNSSPYLLALESTQNRTRHFINDKPLNNLSHVSWSPDNQLVYYQRREREYVGTFVNLQGERLATFSWQNDLEPLGWSADNRYLALVNPFYRPPTTLSIISVDGFRKEFVASPSTETTSPVGAWSPTGHQLAYVINNILTVIDPTSALRLETTYAPEALNPHGGRVRWSPDSQYIALPYLSDAAPNYQISIYKVSGDQLQKVGNIDFPVSQESASWYFDMLHWSGHTFVYPRWNDTQTYDLWHFDAETGEARRFLSQIIMLARSGDKLATSRLEGEMLVIEVRDGDGSHPVRARSYPTKSFSYCCGWMSHQRILLSRGSAEYQINFINRRGEVVWSPDEGEYVYGISRGWFPYDGRFMGMSLRGEQPRVVLFDAETEQGYEFPPPLHDTLPRSLFNSAVDWNMIVVPSPDEQSWLIKFEDLGADLTGEGPQYRGALYHFIPAENEWEVLSESYRADNMVWSPDGERFAFTEWNVQDIIAPQLIVIEADHSRTWNLGSFPGYSHRGMQWSQCGGLMAVLRGD